MRVTNKKAIAYKHIVDLSARKAIRAQANKMLRLGAPKERLVEYLNIVNLYDSDSEYFSQYDSHAMLWVSEFPPAFALRNTPEHVPGYLSEENYDWDRYFDEYAEARLAALELAGEIVKLSLVPAPSANAENIKEVLFETAFELIIGYAPVERVKAFLGETVRWRQVEHYDYHEVDIVKELMCTIHTYLRDPDAKRTYSEVNMRWDDFVAVAKDRFIKSRFASQVANTKYYF